MRKRQHRVFYLSRCAVCIALGSTFTHVAWARDYFNPAFIENHGQANRTSVDLSTFDNDKSQLPGTYYVTININKTEIGARNVDFQLATLSDGQQALQGCLRLQELKDNGVKTDLFPTLESEKGCVDLSVIPGASQRFDFQQQALSVSIPQLYIANNARGYVPPEKWQEGITALMLNYSFSGYKEYGSVRIPTMRNRSISLSSRVLTSGRGVFATTVTGVQITARAVAGTAFITIYSATLSR